MSSPRSFIVAALSIISYILLVAVFADYVNPPEHTGERNTSIAFLLAAALAIIGNVKIIHYHATVPPHPKFLMMNHRKFWIRVHAISGSLEVVLGITAWITMNPMIAIATGLVAILGHVPSAYFQTPGVFGTKGIMVPAYFGVVTLHLYCAGRLLMEGGDIVWLERTWMALQAYAYTRIYGLLINNSKTFKDSIYTVSVILAGATITPFILGPAGPICVLFVVLIYVGWFKIIINPNQEHWTHFFQEKERRSLIDDEMRNVWIAKHMGTAVNNSSSVNAKMVFDYLDSDKSGKLSLQEMRELMISWGASSSFIQSFFNHYGNREGIDFHTFLTTLWISGRIQEQLTDNAAAGIREPEAQSRFIFNHLDMDGSGYLEPAEIELLLLEWGMDEDEAMQYMKKYSGQDRQIDYQEFHHQMKPIWRFGFSEVYG